MRNQKLMVPNDFDVKIFEFNLPNVPTLTEENLIHSLCIFIPEVMSRVD